MALLKERRSFREIARLVSVAPETVQAVAQLHADELDKHFSGMGKQLGRIICGFAGSARAKHGLSAGRTDPRGHEGDQPSSKALLQGEATARVEHVTQPVQVSNYEQYLQKIEGFEKKARARIVREGQQTRLAGGKTRRLGAGPAGARTRPVNGHNITQW